LSPGKAIENTLKTMKTTITAFPGINHPSLPRVGWESVRWNIRSGGVARNPHKPCVVSPAIRTGHSETTRLCLQSLTLSLALLRTLGFLVVAVFAVADSILTRIVAAPTAIALAHARAAWLHRWSRAARWVLGVRFEQRGVMPPSGIVTANYSCFLDAILLAAAGPCVFVAGAEVRRWPPIGILARLGGMLFVDPRRRNDLVRINSLIKRAVRRRLLVVIFPECGGPKGASQGPFASGLLQPVVELGCSLTAAAVTNNMLCKGQHSRMGMTHWKGFIRQFAQLVSHRHPRAIGNFCAPAFHHGNRKQLVNQVHLETLDLVLRVALTVGGIETPATTEAK